MLTSTSSIAQISNNSSTCAGGTASTTTYANFVTFGGVDLTSNALPALVYVQIGCVSSVTDSSASVRWESVTFDTQMVGALQGDVQP